MYKAPYTEEQKAFITENCSKMTAAELVLLLNETFHDNRTKKGLLSYMQANDLHCIRPKNTLADGFTEEQKDFMRDHGAYMSRKELTDLMTIYFGVEMNYYTVKSWCARNHIPSPHGNGRFTTENSPRWQKGLSKEEFKSHYTEESFQRMFSHTIESNIKHHIGDEVIKNGNVYIVVNDDFGKGFCGRLALKSHLIWEKEKGPIPPDHFIMHMDGDKLNCDISNLRCVPKKYRPFFAHYGWWTSEPEVKETALLFCELHFALKDVK